MEPIAVELLFLQGHIASPALVRRLESAPTEPAQPAPADPRPLPPTAGPAS